MADRHGLLVSQSGWLWGGELGVKQRSVLTGNEAVFTRWARKRGEALAVITEHLERFGQGGPAGYDDKGFRYDNSFLIADAGAVWGLGNCGRPNGSSSGRSPMR